MTARALRGFTLVEMLVVVTIISVLAMMVMPMAELANTRLKERELKRSLWQIRDAIDAYKKAADLGRIAKARTSGYPPSLTTLTEGVPELTSGGGTLRFLREIPRDPFAPDGVSPERSWGLRSFESSADDPRPGEDVFDVHSLSERTGTNGVPLRRW